MFTENDAWNDAEARIEPRIIQKQYPWGGELAFDELAVERGLEIRLDGKTVGRTARTPGQDADLVAGYLFSEGYVASASEIAALSFFSFDEHQDCVDALLRPERQYFPDQGRSLDLRIDPDDLTACFDQMERKQTLFRRTGATHCAALFDAEGAMLALAEDIGRHNALDKVLGMTLRANRIDRAAILTMSSRLSVELVSKVALTPISIMAGISCATGQAVSVAEERGLTLVGRVRKQVMNIYCHGERVGAAKRSQRNPALTVA